MPAAAAGCGSRPDQPATLDFERFAGTIGGSKVQGRGAIRFDDVPRLDGSIEADTLDAPAVIAAAIGMSAKRGGGAGWSTEPIAWNAAALNGRIAFNTQRAVFSPWLVAQDLSGVARLNGAEVVFEDVAGEFNKGRLDGRLAVSNAAAGVTARLWLGITGAELGTIFASAGRPAMSGRLTLETEIEGAGRSPASFIGSLAGFGSITLEQARLAGLNPDVFNAVTRAVELGIPTSGNRIREFVAGALDSAGLPVSKASASISINAGQARLRDVVIRTDGADLQAAVNVDLGDAMLDALLTLNAPPQSAGAAPPALMVALKGALPAPRRTVDTTPLTSWLTLRELEQQSRQLEAMEKAARESAAAGGAALPKPAEPGPRLVVPESAPTVPAPKATDGISGGAASAGAAAPNHDTSGAETARRAADRQSGSGRRGHAARKPGVSRSIRRAALRSLPAARSGRGSPRPRDPAWFDCDSGRARTTGSPTRDCHGGDRYRLMSKGRRGSHSARRRFPSDPSKTHPRD
jgi:large subunit ribosomal protein L24